MDQKQQINTVGTGGSKVDRYIRRTKMQLKTVDGVKSRQVQDRKWTKNGRQQMGQKPQINQGRLKVGDMYSKQTKGRQVKQVNKIISKQIQPVEKV